MTFLSNIKTSTYEKETQIIGLKVQSFVTNLANSEQQTIAGGDKQKTQTPACYTFVPACVNSKVFGCGPTNVIFDCTYGCTLAADCYTQDVLLCV